MRTPETRYAKGRGGCVAYQVIGDGPLDLVFIPNWVTNLDVMREEPVPAAPASDNARLRHGEAVHGRGGRRRRAFMLSTLSEKWPLCRLRST